MLFFQGKQLHILKDHAHWVTTLALNTDFVLRTGPFDHTGKRPSSDEEGDSSTPRDKFLINTTHQPKHLPSKDTLHWCHERQSC